MKRRFMYVSVITPNAFKFKDLKASILFSEPLGTNLEPFNK